MDSITTDRLILRAFRDKDAYRVQELAGNKRISDMATNIPYPYSNDLALKWIGTHNELYKTGKGYIFAITISSTNELVGAISITDIKNHTAMLGYWIGFEYWNQGYCTEACKALISFAKNNLNLTTINAEHIISNISSGKVLRKCGFRQIDKNEQKIKYTLPLPPKA